VYLLSSDTSRTPRKRRYVSPALLSILRLVFRRSDSRDAYVLRLVGNRRGPVLKPAHQDPRRLR
jgi:hypothetical protein